MCSYMNNHDVFSSTLNELNKRTRKRCIRVEITDAARNRKWNQRCATGKCPLSSAQFGAVSNFTTRCRQKITKISHWGFKGATHMFLPPLQSQHFDQD